MEKIAWDGPKWGLEVLFPPNPDLADILGDTDFDFDNFIFLDFLDPEFLDFQVPRFPEIWLCQGQLRASLRSSSRITKLSVKPSRLKSSFVKLAAAISFYLPVLSESH